MKALKLALIWYVWYGLVTWVNASSPAMDIGSVLPFSTVVEHRWSYNLACSGLLVYGVYLVMVGLGRLKKKEDKDVSGEVGQSGECGADSDSGGGSPGIG